MFDATRGAAEGHSFIAGAVQRGGGNQKEGRGWPADFGPVWSPNVQIVELRRRGISENPLRWENSAHETHSSSMSTDSG